MHYDICVYIYSYIHFRGHPCTPTHLISENFHIGRMAARNRMATLRRHYLRGRDTMRAVFTVLPAKSGNIGTGECPRAIHGPGDGIRLRMLMPAQG